MTDSAGEAENRSSVSPIWEVVNELVVGFLLERAVGWEFLQHEPAGHRKRVGEWEFRSPSGRVVFVEVKTLVEPDRYPPVFNRAVATGRLTQVLRRAYRQLPRDDRSTLVIIVGTGLILEASHGIYHSDLFQTLFGRIQITFQVLPYVEGSERMAPAFREMFVHQHKHRRLGAVAGLAVGGTATPGLGFYVINNPFADDDCQLAEDDFSHLWRFWIDREGVGLEKDGASGTDLWARVIGA
jgi:hypothetical protein